MEIPSFFVRYEMRTFNKASPFQISGDKGEGGVEQKSIAFFKG